jgi:hypothetical protein
VQVYTYRWNRCGRIGRRCIVTARGKMNSCRLEFEDGFKMITSRNAIARWRWDDWPTWGTVKTIEDAPDGASYVCGIHGWCYYIAGSDIIAAPHPRLKPQARADRMAQKP